jgi:hypothetical protein
MNRADLSADEQTAILADRYSQRADTYDELWSPVTRSTSRLRLLSLDEGDRGACLRRIRERLAGSGDAQYVYSGEVVMAIAQKAGVGGHPQGEDDG